MFDQRLWKTHIRLREQQFMREAENDRLADDHQREHTLRNSLALALRDAIAVIRARIVAASYAGTQPADAQAPMPDETAAAILAEAEEVVRSYTGAPSDSNCCPC